MKIRQLEWKKAGAKNHECYSALTFFYRYTTYKSEIHGFCAELSTDLYSYSVGNGLASIDEAKRLCQQHFEAAMTDALEDGTTDDDTQKLLAQVTAERDELRETLAWVKSKLSLGDTLGAALAIDRQFSQGRSGDDGRFTN